MEYTLIRSRRKTVSLEIKNGSLLVRAPLRMSKARIEAFLIAHKSWIASHLAQADRARELAGSALTKAQLEDLYRQAKDVIPERVLYFAGLIGVDYGKITIRCQKTRWGSCSAAGNLNFNCLLMLAPAAVLDSVVVHELCHRKEMNHSSRFYREVYRVFPDYEIHHKWLKEHGTSLLMKVPQEEP